MMSQHVFRFALAWEYPLVIDGTLTLGWETPCQFSIWYFIYFLSRQLYWRFSPNYIEKTFWLKRKKRPRYTQTNYTKNETNYTKNKANYTKNETNYTKNEANFDLIYVQIMLRKENFPNFVQNLGLMTFQCDHRTEFRRNFLPTYGNSPAFVSQCRQFRPIFYLRIQKCNSTNYDWFSRRSKKL